jgi:hypothetical protein
VSLQAHGWIIGVRLLLQFDPSTSSGFQEGGLARSEIVLEVGGWEGEHCQEQGASLSMLLGTGFVWRTGWLRSGGLLGSPGGGVTSSHL